MRPLDEASTVLVSACLLGLRCRYDGGECGSEAVALALRGKEVVPICPEAAAGLGTPRAPVQLSGGDGTALLAGKARALRVSSGEECTEPFAQAALLAVRAAARFGAVAAILKEQSPSCGVHRVWIDGALAPGQGVAAAALRAAGVEILSDEELQVR